MWRSFSDEEALRTRTAETPPLTGRDARGRHLAWVGDNHLVFEPDQEAADPRAVGADLHDHQGIGVFLRKPTQALAVIRDVALVNDLAGRSQSHADRVLRISKVDSDNVLSR